MSTPEEGLAEGNGAFAIFPASILAILDGVDANHRDTCAWRHRAHQGAVTDSRHIARQLTCRHVLRALL